MKKEKRIPYLILTKVEIDDGSSAILCSFCRYAEWVGENCEDAECNCHHPLWEVNELEYDAAIYGSDCWGFRPAVSADIAADIVGYWLRREGIDWDTVPLIGK